MNSRGNRHNNKNIRGGASSSNITARPSLNNTQAQGHNIKGHGLELAPMDQADLDTFRLALKELTFNSRPIIEKLTTMARERARTIPGPVSRTILDNLVFNNPNYRSCFIFLIDSIIKTVGDPFPASFIKHGLVSAYLRVFGEICAAGDEQQKRDFLRVLPTWNGIIAPEALGEIEAKVTMVTGTPVHVNIPASNTTTTFKPSAPTPTAPTSVKFSHLSPVTIKLLSDLQAVFENPPGPRISGIVSEIFKRLSRSGEVPREVLVDLDFKAKQVDKKVIIGTLKEMIKDNNRTVNPITTTSSTSSPYNIPTTTTTATDSSALSDSNSIPLNFELPPNFQIDLSLLSSIVELNKLNTSSNSSIPNSPSKTANLSTLAADKHFVDIPVNSADLLIIRPNLFKILYDDLPLHCKTCGIRFRDTELGRQRLTLHLDSHFRRNMRLKEKSKRVLARDLFGSEDDWISAKEDFDNLTERTVNIFEDSNSQVNQDFDKFESFVEASEEEQSSQIKCSTCQETISVIWNDEREQWIFPACIRNEFNQIIHVTCQKSEAEAEAENEKDKEIVSKRRKLK